MFKNLKTSLKTPLKIPLKIPMIRALFVYLFLSNLIFWILSRYVYLTRPLFNLDYLLIGALTPWFLSLGVLGRVLSIFLYFSAFSTECFVHIAPIYHFELTDAILWLPQLRHVRWTYWVPAVSSLLFLGLMISTGVVKFGSRKENRKTVTAVLLIIGFLLGLIDISNGTSFIELPIVRSFVNVANVNVAYSGIRRSMVSLMPLTELKATLEFTALNPSDQATRRWMDQARRGIAFAKKNLVLVLVESMGLPLNSEFSHDFFYPIASDPEMKKLYDVKVGTVPYSGSTIYGELRELCGVRLTGYSEQGYPQCLPALLRPLGYESIAFHGFTHQFYNRNRWYPKLQFDQALFAEDLRKQGLNSKCGSVAFEGLCDAEIAKLIHQKLLETKKPQFLYWLTLNSHLPLGKVNPGNSQFDCQSHLETRSDPDICTQSQWIRIVLDSVAQIARDPALPPTEFVIVGDHPSPFFDLKEKGLYSSDRVPWIVLTPTFKKLALDH